LHLADRTTVLGTTVSYTAFPPVTAMLQTLNAREVEVIVEFLSSQKWIHAFIGECNAIVTGDGFIQAEQWKRTANNQLKALWPCGLTTVL
jgi:hypothetical protein